MRIWTLVIATAALGLGFSAMPAAAQVFSDDGWFPFTIFHHYGDDVNRPGATPDRPYWHGDDAVPLALRWHEPGELFDQYGNVLPPPEPVEGIGVAVGAAAVVHAPRHRRTHIAARRRRVRTAVARKDCPPAAKVGAAAMGGTASLSQ